MIRVLAALVALAAALPAVTAAWTYAPLVVYEDEPATLVLAPATAADAWRVVEPVLDEGPVLGDGQLTLTITPNGHDLVRLRAGDGRSQDVRFVRPGAARDLSIDGEGQPTLGGGRVILVLSRIEARADRRWGLLRDGVDHAAKPCTLGLPAPTVVEGVPVLTAQIHAAQALAVRGQGVLIELSAGDRFAGWKHREYRQCLAWLVADLQARGAVHIALVPPVAARPRDDDLHPLRIQVANVAEAYRCRVVDVAGLSDPDLWEVAPGVIGLGLNARGQARRDEMLAPWRAR